MFFSYVKYKYSERLFNTLYIEINKNVKKIPLDKINVTKNTLFFSFTSSN